MSITLMSLMTAEETKKATRSLNAIDICNKLFIDLTVEDFTKLCHNHDIFDQPYTTDLFRELYDRFGERCKELKHEML